MKLHEYQAKELFSRYGLPIPEGWLAKTPEKAMEHVGRRGFPIAIKAQVHAGGRGKSGGILLASNMEDAYKAVYSIHGMRLRTPQTVGEGPTVNKLLLEKGVDIDREFYLSIVPDSSTGSLLIIASAEGGMDIEEVAATHPEKILQVQVDPVMGLQEYQKRRVAYALGLTGELFASFATLLAGLYQAVLENDLLLAEINPLALTVDGDFFLIDAKAKVDSNALFRQKKIAAQYDSSEEDPLELEAQRHGLNYIRLHGNIGTIVNGAGLAMASMDIIQQAGAEPANFLDVGGGANEDMIEHGFQILLSDPHVKAILINIFGGILRCDILATGVVNAARKTGLQLPVVVRMEGTNAEQGRKILAESGLDLITATDLNDASTKIQELCLT
ncbi:MAG: ADP-forming succinate--CoA ligase subunit beta [Candidatus Electrothrix sp. AW1]|nr:ADP-forming succinate--CoA ligase subunit beta [Candidatus Electrothrix sp. AX1]MCI5181648.1 ADP-forming succinate--CoA ligase subunit beta [Candidatus Electrothrix gigas]